LMFENFFPKCFTFLRVFQCQLIRTVAIPKACEAMPILPPFKTLMAKLNQTHLLPILFSFAHHWKVESVSEPRIPFSFLLDQYQSSPPFSTIKDSFMPFQYPFAAMTMYVVAEDPFVIQFFCTI
jgi:hypothetical protein